MAELHYMVRRPNEDYLDYRARRKKIQARWKKITRGSWFFISSVLEKDKKSKSTKKIRKTKSYVRPMMHKQASKGR